MGRRSYRQGHRSGHRVVPNIISSLGNKLGMRRVAVTLTLVVLVAAGCGTTPAPSASEAFPSDTTTAPATQAPETTRPILATTGPLPVTTVPVVAETVPVVAETVPVVVATVPVVAETTPRPPSHITLPKVIPAPAHPPAASQPSATAQPRPLPWTTASSLPTGQQVTADVMANQVRIGSCLAHHPDLAAFPQLVPCSGPHTDEVTRTEDLTAHFPTMPTNDQEDALGNELCPAALMAWTGGDEPRYSASFGSVGWHFVCTAMLASHDPFTGTLKGAASK